MNAPQYYMNSASTGVSPVTMFLIYFWVVVILTLILVLVYTAINLNTFSQLIHSAPQTFNADNRKLPSFSTNYTLANRMSASTINRENSVLCTPISLTPCNINRIETCIGCSSLTSTCHHFSKDSEYVDANGVRSHIPKNKADDEGYCLSMETLDAECNTFHGNYVVVQLEENSHQVFLKCECTRPGLVGNINIRGACDQAFMCEVENINVPFEQLQCKCDKHLGFFPEHVNNVPVCAAPPIKYYTDFDSLYFDKPTVPKSVFATDISLNFNGSRLLNPCNICALTGRVINNHESLMRFDETSQSYFCVSDGTSVPIRLSETERILKGARGPDAALAVTHISRLNVIGHLDDVDYYTMEAVIPVKGNEALARALFPSDEYEAHKQSKHFTIVLPHWYNLIYPLHFMHNISDIYALSYDLYVTSGMGGQTTVLPMGELLFSYRTEKQLELNKRSGNINVYYEQSDDSWWQVIMPQALFDLQKLINQSVSLGINTKDQIQYVRLNENFHLDAVANLNLRSWHEDVKLQNLYVVGMTVKRRYNAETKTAGHFISWLLAPNKNEFDRIQKLFIDFR